MLHRNVMYVFLYGMHVRDILTSNPDMQYIPAVFSKRGLPMTQRAEAEDSILTNLDAPM